MPMRFKLKSGEPFTFAAFGTPGNNRMEVFCGLIRLSPRNPTTCYARFTTECLPC